METALCTHSPVEQAAYMTFMAAGDITEIDSIGWSSVCHVDAAPLFVLPF